MCDIFTFLVTCLLYLCHSSRSLGYRLGTTRRQSFSTLQEKQQNGAIVNSDPTAKKVRGHVKDKGCTKPARGSGFIKLFKLVKIFAIWNMTRFSDSWGMRSAKYPDGWKNVLQSNSKLRHRRKLFVRSKRSRARATLSRARLGEQIPPQVFCSCSNLRTARIR